MPDEAILAGIRKVAARLSPPPPPLEPDLRLVEDLRLQSLQILELALKLEEEFGIVIEERAEFRIHTVRDLVKLVRDRIDAPKSASA